MQWPAADIRLLAFYLSREPMPEERIEYVIAQLAAIYINTHRNQSMPAKSTADFMSPRNTWKEKTDSSSGRYSDLDREFLAALMADK